jgi:hypothetical protein
MATLVMPAEETAIEVPQAEIHESESEFIVDEEMQALAFQLIRRAHLPPGETDDCWATAEEAQRGRASWF